MTTKESVSAPVTIPTVILVATSPASLASVGGLRLVVRAVLTLRAAGFADIAVLAAAQEAQVSALLARRCATADVTWLGVSRPVDPTRWSNPVLVLSADVVFDQGTLTTLVTASGRVGIVVPTPSGEVGALTWPLAAVRELVAGLDSDARTLGQAIQRLGGPSGTPVPLGEGLFAAVDGAHSPAQLTRALLEHLGRRTASTDGYLAALLDRHLSRLITRLALPHPWATPNRITLASILVGLVGAMGLAAVSYRGRLGGTVALLASSVLDGVDGEVARARFEQSAAGARLDLAGDYTVHVTTFLGLGIGLVREGLPAAGAWAAVALVAGVVAAMVLVHTLVLRSSRRTTVTATVERVAGRDYTYLLFLGALVGHLEWFLYAAAVGSWVFVAALLVHWARSRTGAGGRDGRRRPG